MRILERYDAGLIASECLKFWRDAGMGKNLNRLDRIFRRPGRIRIQVTPGNVRVTMTSGWTLPPRKTVRAAWNRQKYLGVAYTVERRTWFGLKLWDSKHWDDD